MDNQERILTTTDTIDIPLPSEELQQSLEGQAADVRDYVQVEEIPQAAGNFSASYRRC